MAKKVVRKKLPAKVRELLVGGTSWVLARVCYPDLSFDDRLKKFEVLIAGSSEISTVIRNHAYPVNTHSRKNPLDVEG